MINFFDRLDKYMENKGLNDNKISIKSGISNGLIGKGRSRGSISQQNISKILNTYSDLNADWLLTGKGKMLRTETTMTIDQSIPLIPVDAMAGVSRGEINIMELDCERYIIPSFKGADYLINVKGSSMYPKYSSGDVVACKKVGLQDIFFQWNKVYVLDTEQGALIKRIQKHPEDDGSIVCMSENASYKPFDLHKSQIYAIAIVIGVIRLE